MEFIWNEEDFAWDVQYHGKTVEKIGPEYAEGLGEGWQARLNKEVDTLEYIFASKGLAVHLQHILEFHEEHEKRKQVVELVSQSAPIDLGGTSFKLFIKLITALETIECTPLQLLATWGATQDLLGSEAAGNMLHSTAQEMLTVMTVGELSEHIYKGTVALSNWTES